MAEQKKKDPVCGSYLIYLHLHTQERGKWCYMVCAILDNGCNVYMFACMVYADYSQCVFVHMCTHILCAVKLWKVTYRLIEFPSRLTLCMHLGY